MAQYITLEEAAERLGMPVDEFKRRLKMEWTHLVPMRDGPTLRFRMNQIEELARQLGGASDQGLPLAGLKSDVEPGSEDFQVSVGAKGKQPAEEPLLFDSSEDDIFSLSADAPKAGSGKSGKQKKDSDVRLEEKSDKDAAVVPTEEIALDVSGPGSAVIKGGSSAKLSAPKSSAKLSASDSGKKLSSPDLSKSLASPGSGDSSEFELSLDADSDDFELQMASDSSAEVDLGSSSLEEKPGGGGKSGVNLRAPSDRGISLEKGKKGSSGRHGQKPDSGKKADSGKRTKPDLDSDSDLDFELSLEPEPDAPGSSKRGSGRKSSPRVPVTSDSDSEFELTLDDSGEGSSLEAAAIDDESKGDIFETDFEIPPMTDESGSEAVALDSDTDLDEQSEVELALEEGDAAIDEESGSQVVLLEDEDEAPAHTASGRRRKPSSAVDLADVEEEEESVGSALAGVRGRRRDADEEDEEEEEEAVGAGAGRAAAPAAWGPLPAIILFPAFFLVLLGTLAGYEILHTMVGYQQPNQPPAPIVRGIAGTLDMELRDQ